MSDLLKNFKGHAIKLISRNHTKMDHSDFKKIVIITYPLPKKDSGVESYNYYSSYVFLLAKSIQDKFRNADVIIKIPGKSNNHHNDQMDFISDASKDKVNYIIVSPYNANNFYDEFKRMEDDLKLISTRKIIFIDQGFEYPTPDQVLRKKNEALLLPPYAQANWEKGGEAAAKSAYKYFIEVKITTPRIVILHGGPGSEKRVEGFINFLDKQTPRFYPTYYKYNAEYSRGKSKEFFKTFLEETKNSQSKIDLVFCTNDEMGLGVREALIESKWDIELKKQEINKLTPKIIGFDGIPEFTLMLNKEDTDYIYDTVLVGLDNQIDAIIDIISNHNEYNELKEEKRIYFTSDCKSFREEKGWS